MQVFKAVVGKPSTPTPHGEFFVEESIQLQSDAVGAPFALALSARSDVFQEFDGGPGQIALHGLDNVGGTLGTAASHGCVRLADASMRWLVTRVGPGAPGHDHADSRALRCQQRPRVSAPARARRLLLRGAPRGSDIMRNGLRRVLERLRAAGKFRPRTSVRGGLQQPQRSQLIPAPARSRPRS